MRLLLLAAAAAALAAAPASAVKPAFTVAPAIDWEWTTHAALSVTAEIDVGGRLRCVALAPGADEPTAAEVAAGAYAFGATPPGSLVVSATSSAGVVRATIDFLAAETAYDVWCVAEDASADRQSFATKATGVSVTAPAEAWQYTGDQCVGARRNPVERLNTVVFVASADNRHTLWDNDNVCPGGMHWATLQEFKDSQVGSQAFSNSQCNSVSFWTYFTHCGWVAYPTFGTGQGHQWIFSDSASNGQYVHSGNYACNINTSGFRSSSTVFAGLVCLPGGGVSSGGATAGDSSSGPTPGDSSSPTPGSKGTVTAFLGAHCEQMVASQPFEQGVCQSSDDDEPPAKIECENGAFRFITCDDSQTVMAEGKENTCVTLHPVLGKIPLSVKVNCSAGTHSGSSSGSGSWSGTKTGVAVALALLFAVLAVAGGAYAVKWRARQKERQRGTTLDDASAGEDKLENMVEGGERGDAAELASFEFAPRPADQQ